MAVDLFFETLTTVRSTSAYTEGHPRQRHQRDDWCELWQGEVLNAAGWHRVKDLGPGIFCSLSVYPLWVRKKRKHMQFASAQGERSPRASSRAAPGEATCSLSPRCHTGKHSLEICLDREGWQQAETRLQPLTMQKPG